MDVLYLNAAARLLIPAGRIGRRCRQAFPVAKDLCADRCHAVWAAGHSEEIVSCEKTIHPGNGAPVRVGVAVTPLRDTRADGERAFLLLRPKPPDAPGDAFKGLLVKDARRFEVLGCAHIGADAD